MTQHRQRRQPRSNDSGSAELQAARSAYANRSWSDAHDLFTRIDRLTPLEAEDLDRLATAAYLLGKDDEYFTTLERAYHAHASSNPGRATLCAFWLGLCLMFAGRSARANGWLARAQGLVEREGNLHAEAGYLLLPQIERQLGAGDWESAATIAKQAIQIGERYGEPDLTACARHVHGRALLGACQMESAFALLDEVMLDVACGTLSPIMTGLIYCSVIDACQQVYAVARAREWTDALAEWCDRQPQMIAFSGTCLVHRAEIMQLSGQWPAAIHEARRACDRYRKAELQPAGAALYRQAEVHRLRGDYDAAEKSYRQANESGFEPQPGLALLRLEQDNKDVACGSIRRLVAACDDPLNRTRLLPACVEIMLAVGEVDTAQKACEELMEIAGRFGTEVLAAMAAHAQAAVSLAQGHAQVTLGLAKRAFEIWQRVEAPYEAARARILAGLACRGLNDDEGAQLELEAAQRILEQLGAAPELARVRRLCGNPRSKTATPHGLTPRELEVLQHLAAGKTNKAIAAELHVSDKTVDRHLSNIFNKLGVSTRSAATAYAYEHKLL